MNAPTDPVLDIRNLTKKFGEFTALHDLSLSLRRGQILGFIGPNGAGKTTTIKILVGAMRPSAGTATIAGADCVRDAWRIKRLVGYMPDTFGAYDNMRVREYLDFLRRLRPPGAARADRRGSRATLGWSDPSRPSPRRSKDRRRPHAPPDRRC